MAQSPAYNRVKDFGADYPDQTDNQAINTELDAVSSSVNAIRTNLALIQRDDGGLRDGIVTKDSLAQSLKDELYAEFSGNINDSVLEAQQAAVEATNAALAANADAATASSAKDAAQTAATSAQASAAAASESQSAAATSATAAQASATAAASSASSAAGSATTASTAAGSASSSSSAAAASASSASTSASTATSAKSDAQTAAAAAAGSASSAAGSASTAKDWAVKMDGPISGSDFSAKYYAAQAMAGAGLPIYPPGAEPTTDVGEIWIKGIGPCAWDVSTSRYWRIPSWSNRQVFTSSGTFTTDAYTRNVRISGVGAGGYGGISIAAGATGGGGSGAWIDRQVVSVTASTAYTVAVGASVAAAGGSSSFGSLVVLGGGSPGGATGSAVYTAGGAGGTTATAGAMRGQAGAPGSTNNPHGFGGSNPFGQGGVNLNFYSVTPAIGATGYGAGGPGCPEAQNAYRAGANGLVIVEF